MLKQTFPIALVVLCLTALVVLDSCNPKHSSWQPTSKPQYFRTAESILEAGQGDWRLVEEEEFHSPVNDHLAARGHVDTSRRSISKELRAHAKLEEARVRTLILVKDAKQIASLDEFLEMKMALLLPDVPLKPQRKPTLQVAEANVTQDVKKKTISSKSAQKEASRFDEIEPAAGDPGQGPIIASVRFGEHPGKTRMVVDITNEAAYHMDINNETGIMTVTVDQAGWNAGLNSKLMQHPLILGYRAQKSNDGTVIALKLKKPARVKWSADLPPEDGKNHRLVFDIATL